METISSYIVMRGIIVIYTIDNPVPIPNSF